MVDDLAEFDLPAAGVREPFDAAVIAGNVMAYVASGTEPLVLARVAAHVRGDGVVVVGFGTDRGYPITDFDAHAAAAGLTRPVEVLERWQSFGATWRVVSRTEGSVTVALCRCDGGEEVGRMTSTDADLLGWLADKTSSKE